MTCKQVQTYNYYTLQTASSNSSFVASSVAMISAGCVWTRGVYITTGLGDTSRKSLATIQNHIFPASFC